MMMVLITMPIVIINAKSNANILQYVIKNFVNGVMWPGIMCAYELHYA